MNREGQRVRDDAHRSDGRMELSRRDGGDWPVVERT
jgi:hypothetical protein